MRQNLLTCRYFFNLSRLFIVFTFLCLFVGCVPPEVGGELKIESIIPATGSVEGGFEVNIKGEELTFVEKITLNGIPCSQPTVTSTNIKCTAPAMETPGEVRVELRSKGNRSGLTTFTYTVSNFTVDSFSPQTSESAGGSTLSIRGTNFISGMSVMIGNTPCLNVKLLSPTFLQCNLPARSVGDYEVKVSSRFMTLTASSPLIYMALPTIGSVSPNKGSIKGGTPIEITGNNFLSSATVQVGPGSCKVTFVDSDTIKCTTPAGIKLGSTKVTVTQPGNLVVSRDNIFSYLTPPTVLSVTPSEGGIYGGRAITIKGRDFTNGSIVNIGTRPCVSPDVLNSETITCTTGSNEGQVGIYPVTVIDANDLRFSLINAFSYQEGPIITNLSPIGTPNTVPAVLTILGTNFRPESRVKIVSNSSIAELDCPLVTTPTTTRIDCRTPLTVLSGDMDIIVINPDTQESIWTNFGFRNPPTIAAITPGGGPANGTNWPIQITGSGFSDPKVKVGNVDCNVTSSTSTTINCSIAASANVGYVSVVVTNQFGLPLLSEQQSSPKLNGYFFNNGPKARETIPVSPIGGPPAGETAIKIFGSGFYGIPVVEILPTIGDGNKQCLNVTALSGEISCTTPPLHEGDYHIVVRNPDTQNIIISNAFKVRPPPSISALVQNFAGLTGGVIKIEGHHFQPDIKVSIGDIPCPVVPGSLKTNTTPHEVQCTAPARAAGVVDVTVTNPDLQKSNTRPFTYRSPPTITNITPNTGSTTGGTEVTVLGTNFYPGIKLYFGSSPCSSVTLLSATSLKCLSTPVGSGAVTLKVENLEGQNFETSTSNVFTYIAVPILKFMVGTSNPPPNPADYGTTSTNSDLTFILKNIGEAPSSQISVTLTGTDPSAWFISADNCKDQILAPNIQCTVQVTFLGLTLSAKSYAAVLNAAATAGGTTTNELKGTRP